MKEAATSSTKAFAGGIVGEYAGPNGILSVQFCKNVGHVSVEVSGTPTMHTSLMYPTIAAGGLVGSALIERGILSALYCHNEGLISAACLDVECNTFAAGILGCAEASADIEVHLRACTNVNDIKATSSSLSTQRYVVAAGSMGKIETFVTVAAGLVASSSRDTPGSIALNDCSNNGNVTGDAYACGLANVAHYISNGINTGTVKGQDAYGIARRSGTLRNVVNIGTVTSNTESGKSCQIASWANITSNVYQNTLGNTSCTTGKLMNIDTNSRKWLTVDAGEDVVTTLNDNIADIESSMCWTRDLVFGSHIALIGPGVPPTLERQYIVTKHDETLRQALTREAPELLDTNKYAFVNVSLDDTTGLLTKLTVISVHKLVFTGLASATLYVVDGNVLTAEQQDVVQPIVTNRNHVVVPPFNASAPVTASATYNVTQGTKIVLVIEDSGNDTDTIGDQVRDVLVSEDPDSVVRVVDVIRNEDGSVTVVVVVEEGRVDAVLDVVAKTDDGVLRRVRQWYVEDSASLGSSHVLSSPLAVVVAAAVLSLSLLV